jgi:cytochrome bd-type quinol oxidase subunit 2
MMNQQSEASNGLVAAAMLAAGIGCFFLGLMTDLSESIKAVENILTFSNPVGALSGKTIVAIVLWLVSWAILASKWKDQEVNFGKVYNITIILVALGILMTCPLFFDVL